MSPLTVAMRASELILSRKEELAHAVTDALYAEDPRLLERFGELGRAKCLQDMRYCLEHLAPALALDDPSLFTRYVHWVESLLAVRGIASGDVRRSLETMQRVIAGRIPPDETAFTLSCLRAGVISLSDDTAP